MFGLALYVVLFTLADALTPVRSARVRVLAVSGAQRPEFAPEVPAFGESDDPIEGSGRYAVSVPARIRASGFKATQ